MKIANSDFDLVRSLGRLLAIDVGLKRVGVAVSDEMRLTVRPLDQIERRSWKDLLRRIQALIESNSIRGLVIGLPLTLKGEEGTAAQSMREVARKFRLSLQIPVYLQDERLTTFAAKANMKAEGRGSREIERQIDSEAAAVILRDFIASNSALNQSNHR